MSSPIIFTDLDDTLFQTTRKLPENHGNLTVMSTLEDGSESGYATQKQSAFLDWLMMGHVIPVTARGRDVLARVHLAHHHAICANGGVILRNTGPTPDDSLTLDEEWNERMTTAAKDAPVQIIKDAIAPLLDERVRSWPVIEGDLELYYCVKSNDGNMDHLAAIAAVMRPKLNGGWRVHHNGNNLAFLPPWLNKRHAVQYLIEQLRKQDPHRPVIGIGDSHSDTGFMDLCDYAMTPTNSQIWTAFKENSEWCR